MKKTMKVIIGLELNEIEVDILEGFINKMNEDKVDELYGEDRDTAVKINQFFNSIQECLENEPK